MTTKITFIGGPHSGWSMDFKACLLEPGYVIFLAGGDGGSKVSYVIGEGVSTASYMH